MKHALRFGLAVAAGAALGLLVVKVRDDIAQVLDEIDRMLDQGADL